MKKKYYTVFFASDWNQYSRSFQISKKEIIFLALFGILLIGLAVVGGLRITNQEPLTRELRSLQKDQMLLKNIINDLDLSMNVDSSNAYENFILGKSNYGFVLGSVEGFDINTEEEWLVAECISQRALQN